MLGVLKKPLRKMIAGSPWVYRMNTGSCNGCDVELATVALCPRYDTSRFGVKLSGSPKHADIVVITGPMTIRCKDAAYRIFSQIPEPKVVMTVGNCPISGNVFQDSYAIDPPISKHFPVDVSVAGCPPSPWAILDGFVKCIEIWEKRIAEKLD